MLKIKNLCFFINVSLVLEGLYTYYILPLNVFTCSPEGIQSQRLKIEGMPFEDETFNWKKSVYKTVFSRFQDGLDIIEGILPGGPITPIFSQGVPNPSLQIYSLVILSLHYVLPVALIHQTNNSGPIGTPCGQPGGPRVTGRSQIPVYLYILLRYCPNIIYRPLH